MIPRFKKDCKVICQCLTKEEFLVEHNKLSPLNLQATVELLSRFEIEKPALCNNRDWSVDKVRRPFIMWITSLNAKEIKKINRGSV